MPLKPGFYKVKPKGKGMADKPMSSVFPKKGKKSPAKAPRY